MRSVKPSIITLPVLLVLTVLAACVTTERFERMMGGYLGVPISELQQHFGYNYIERQLAEGNRAYTWVWKEKGVFPGHETPTTIQTYSSDRGQHVVVIPGTYFPPSVYHTSCEFSFIADKSGKTVSWRAHGNGCAYYSGPGRILAPAGRP